MKLHCERAYLADYSTGKLSKATILKGFAALKVRRLVWTIRLSRIHGSTRHSRKPLRTIPKLRSTEGLWILAMNLAANTIRQYISVKSAKSLILQQHYTTCFWSHQAACNSHNDSTQEGGRSYTFRHQRLLTTCLLGTWARWCVGRHGKLHMRR